jgi:hypothetical protein
MRKQQQEPSQTVCRTTVDSEGGHLHFDDEDDLGEQGPNDASYSRLDASEDFSYDAYKGEMRSFLAHSGQRTLAKSTLGRPSRLLRS